jgi:hypothetical protein
MRTVFYATVPANHVRRELPAEPIMLTAASQEAHSRQRGVIKAADVPAQVTEIAVDPGGFVAATHGGYKFTWDRYVSWLHTLGPRLTWAAFPDLPCERELADDAAAVRWRQEQTLEWVGEFWSADDTEGFDDRVRQPWAWVPTVQGRELHEYLWMAERMERILGQQLSDYDYTAYGLDVIDVFGEDGEETDESRHVQAWAEKGATYRRIGIGSLCQRPAKEVVPIVRGIASALPGQRFHLWGIDMRALQLLQRAGLMNVVASFDSATYNGRFGRDIPKIDAERKRMGMTQAAHAVQVLLPRRQARVRSILRAGEAQPQLPL